MTRDWCLPLTYPPKIEPVRTGECTQTIRFLVDHKCKCKGKDLGFWKHGESPHHSSGSKKICPKCNGTGIVKAKPKQVGDRVRFYRWTGRPYWSHPEYVTGYMELINVENCRIREEGIDDLRFQGEFGLWEWDELDRLAGLDFIDPPTGEALRDVLIGKNGKIPAEGALAQILRWKP